MENLRKYGAPPFNIAVLHGGPGAPGEMAPVARELASAGWGVLEPLETAASIQGQIEDLKTVLAKEADLPVTLIGFSWGAWLGFIFATSYPAMVRRLLLIGSGPFEEKYADKVHETRLSRLSEKDRAEVEALIEALANPANADKNRAFGRLGALLSQADAYDPRAHESEVIDHQVDIFQSVWKEAAELRKNGKLLAMGSHIQCPVVAIHGDYDPHPAQGVQEPLSALLKSFRFVLLQKCGHKPWIERQAKDRFYQVLDEELRR